VFTLIRVTFTLIRVNVTSRSRRANEAWFDARAGTHPAQSPGRLLYPAPAVSSASRQAASSARPVERPRAIGVLAAAARKLAIRRRATGGMAPRGDTPAPPRRGGTSRVARRLVGAAVAGEHSACVLPARPSRSARTQRAARRLAPGSRRGGHSASSTTRQGLAGTSAGARRRGRGDAASRLTHFHFSFKHQPTLRALTGPANCSQRHQMRRAFQAISRHYRRTLYPWCTSITGGVRPRGQKA
jgi:hypothetical protein